MDDENKLGTTVTYLNADGSANEVSMHGVTFKEGESVDLAKEFPDDEAKAKAIAKKLADNPFFQVQGGPKRNVAEKPKPAPQPTPIEDEDDDDAAQAQLETEPGAPSPGRPIARPPGRPPNTRK